MGITVEIISILQEMDLGTMEMNNVLVLRLPNNDHIKLPVSADDAQKIVNARLGLPTESVMEQEKVHIKFGPNGEGGASLDNPAAGGEQLGEMNEEGAIVFGGGGGTQPAPQPEVDAPPPPAPIRQQPPQRRRLQVTKNEMGYPVVQGLEGKDPGEVVDRTAPNQDEDGVPSL